MDMQRTAFKVQKNGVRMVLPFTQGLLPWPSAGTSPKGHIRMSFFSSEIANLRSRPSKDDPLQYNT